METLNAKRSFDSLVVLICRSRRRRMIEYFIIVYPNDRWVGWDRILVSCGLQATRAGFNVFSSALRSRFCSYVIFLFQLFRVVDFYTPEPGLLYIFFLLSSSWKTCPGTVAKKILNANKNLDENVTYLKNMYRYGADLENKSHMGLIDNANDTRH